MEIRLLKWSFNFSGYQKFIWIALFYSLLPVFDMINYSNLELETVTTIGEASIQGYDISARVSLFYKSMLVLILGFSLLMGLGARFANRVGEQEMKLMNQLAILGLFLLLFRVMSTSVHSSLMFVHGGQVLLLLGGLLRPDSRSSLPSYAFLGTLGFILGFALMFLELELNFSLVATGLALSLLLLTRLVWKISMEQLVEQAKPLAVLPLLAFISIELSTILSDRGIADTAEGGIFLVGSILCLGICFRRIQQIKSVEENLGGYYFPATVLGALLYTFFNPELYMYNPFELANSVLPIQQFYEYSRIPILGTLNSHLLSEIVPGFLYTALHGYKGLEFLSYQFLYNAVSSLIAYFVLLKVFRNPYAAVGVVLFLPFAHDVFRSSFMLSLISVVLFVRAAKNPMNYVWLLIWAAFMIVWKLDVGYANVLACAGLILVHYKQILNEGWKQLGISAGILGVLAVIGLWAFGEQANMALHYFSSEQSYGFVKVANWNPVDNIQYFLFPALVLGIILYLILHKKKYTDQRFLWTLLLFMGFFYLANFPRGLVRHGLIEMDVFLSSFVFFILSGFVYLVWTSANTRLLAFMAASVSLIYLVNPTKVFPMNAWEKISTQTRNYPKPELDHGGQEEFYATTYGQFEEFFNHWFEPDQTFLDFTNDPMLYYYIGRRHPGYFSQPLLSSHDEFLQQALIRDIKKLDVPVVVFASLDNEWGHQVDGVPNALRHASLAEFIYKNYRPYGVFDQKEIWIRKDIEDLPDAVAPPIFEDKWWGLGLLPALTKLNAADYKSTILTTGENGLWKLPELDPYKTTYLKLTLSKQVTGRTIEVTIYPDRSRFLFRSEKSDQSKTCMLRLSARHNWYPNEGIGISYDLKVVNIKSVEILQ